MIGLIQRVSHASVRVDKQICGEIDQGILLLLAVEPEDHESQVERLLEKVLNYRVFADADGKMNLSLRDIQGGLLVVSQFTLAANTKKGLRPSFTSAAAPAGSASSASAARRVAALAAHAAVHAILGRTIRCVDLIFGLT